VNDGVANRILIFTFILFQNTKIEVFLKKKVFLIFGMVCFDDYELLKKGFSGFEGVNDFIT
jgi:hypothetical protein